MNQIIFNAHDVIQFVTAGLALLLAIPLAVRRDPQRDELLLAAFLLTQGITALYIVLLYNPIVRYSTVEVLYPLHNLPLALMFLLQGMLLWAYSYAMAHKPLQLRTGDKIAIFIWALLTFSHLSMFFIRSHNDGFDSTGAVLNFPGLALSAYFGFRAIGVLREHNKEIRQYYSNIDNINLLWLSYAAFGFAGTWMIRMGSYFADDRATANLIGVVSNYPGLFLISCMVVLGLRHGNLRSPPDSGSAATDETDKREHNADPNQVDRLEELMTRVKLFQDPNLDLEGLADSMDMSARSLSQLINGHHQCNFYDFVNAYRIEEAKRLLSDTRNAGKSIQRIFEEAGFNSKSTFNTLFKKATGLTPTAFREQAKN